MKITITSIELKSYWKFFTLSATAFGIVKQLKNVDYVDFKKKGMGKKHYTMTLWKNEEDLKNFAHSGAHQIAMKKSSKMAREIKTYTYEGDALPNWKEGIRLLAENGKSLKY
jgi:hypothetical protein